MKTAKALALILALSIAASTLASCQQSPPSEGSNPGTGTGSSGGTAEAPANKPLDPVTLKIIMRGEAPNDMDKVVAKAEELMADTINVKLNLVWMPNSDITNMTRVSLMAGEINDLIWHTGGSADYVTFASQGLLLDLGELAPKYAPKFMSDRPKQMIEYSKYDGKLYALPLGVYNKSGHHYNVRDDLRKELGMEPLESKEDIIEFAYKVKERWPEIPPIVPGAFGQERFTSWATFPHLYGKREENFLMPTNALSGDLMLYYKNNDGKVYNFFDDPEPSIVESLKEARKLYQDGIIYKDVLSLKTYRDAIAENKAAVVSWGDIIPEPTVANRLKSVVPGGEIASVFSYDTTPGELVATFRAWNYQSVAAVSKNPERCLQFLEFTQQNQEIYDLFAYGIKDEHWTDEGEGKYMNISESYRWFPYLWVWNPIYDRVVANATDKEFDMEMFLRKAPASDFVEAWHAPLLFDPSPVKDAFAQYTAAQDQYYGPIFNGVVDTDEYMAKYRAAAYDSLKQIQIELQKQIDALGDRSFVNE